MRFQFWKEKSQVTLKGVKAWKQANCMGMRDAARRTATRNQWLEIIWLVISVWLASMAFQVLISKEMGLNWLPMISQWSRMVLPTTALMVFCLVCLLKAEPNGLAFKKCGVTFEKSCFLGMVELNYRNAENPGL